jgi:hypothetical protein
MFFLAHFFGDSLTMDPYCRIFPVPSEPGTSGVISRGVGVPTVDIDSALRPRTDISTILNRDVSTLTGLDGEARALTLSSLQQWSSSSRASCVGCLRIGLSRRQFPQR